MGTYSSRDERIDGRPGLLANEQCRTVLTHFDDRGVTVATPDGLLTSVTDGESRTERDVRSQHHHAVLPGLAGAALVDYDAGSRTARRRGHSDPDRARRLPERYRGIPS